MLKIEHIKWSKSPSGTDTGNDLFVSNPLIHFTIKAPIYWWIDTDWVKYYLNMPLSDFDFCFDAFENVRPYTEYLVQNVYLWKDEPRKLMQLLPLSTIVRATIELSYRDVVEVCENYFTGEYNYQKGYGFPNSREWTDFCETLLDLHGIRDLMEDE